MSEDQYLKLFKYIEGFREETNRRFDETASKADLDKLIQIMDGYAAKVDAYAQEMAAMQHQINRLEKYIQILADKAKVDLDSISV